MNNNRDHQGVVFSHPIPGQSWTKPPKSTPWQKPPTHVDLQDAMHTLMDQLLEPQHLKDLLGLMEGGMSCDAITKTLLFTGFTTGKWTPDLMLMLYKPLLLAVIMIAHRAGLKDTPVILNHTFDNYHLNNLKKDVVNKQAKEANKAPPPIPEAPPANTGFMQRFSSPQ